MDISLWMLADRLSEYEPKVYCDSNDRNIREVRISYDGICQSPDILYLGSADTFHYDGSDKIICQNQKSYMVLNTSSLYDALNSVLDAFGFFAKWAEKCSNLITAGCSLPELLDLAEDLLPRPMSVVNVSQQRIAYSKGFAAYREDDAWQSMMAHSGFDPDIMMQFNEKYLYTFEQKGLFYLPADFFPTSGWCHHIWVNDRRLATLIVVADGCHFTKGMLQRIELIISYIRSWITANYQSDDQAKTTSYLARILDGAPGSAQSLSEYLQKTGWHDHCPKQLFAASYISAYFYQEAMLSRVLSEQSEGVYAIPYQKNIIILCNYDLIDPTEFFSRFRFFLQTNNYYAAYSLPFRSIDQIPDAYRQTLQTLRRSQPAAGQLYAGTSNVMPYIADIVKQNSLLDLTHPLLSEISAYDESHHTEYYETLFSYLRNERNHQLTAQELFIHRNTLFKRLRKIQELWEISLENPDERFYLLYSFYQIKYARINTETV